MDFTRTRITRSANLHFGVDPQVVLPNQSTFVDQTVVLGLSYIQEAELSDRAGAS